MTCQTCMGFGYVVVSPATYDEPEETEDCRDCLQRGICPKCGELLFNRFYPKAGDWYEWWNNTASALQTFMQRRRLWFGVKVAPWGGNVRRKLLYHLWDALGDIGNWSWTIYHWFFPVKLIPPVCQACAQATEGKPE